LTADIEQHIREHYIERVPSDRGPPRRFCGLQEDNGGYSGGLQQKRPPRRRQFE
jgi:hypothetical protein